MASPLKLTIRKVLLSVLDIMEAISAAACPFSCYKDSFHSYKITGNLIP
jgi:hypothetical protein